MVVGLSLHFWTDIVTWMEFVGFYSHGLVFFFPIMKGVVPPGNRRAL